MKAARSLFQYKKCDRKAPKRRRQDRGVFIRVLCVGVGISEVK